MKNKESETIRESINNQIERINLEYKTVLSTNEERILYPPILAHKIKPKNILGIFQKKWRYLMFTNRKLYTLKPQEYEDGIKNKNKLIANKIDMDFLAHLIFLPNFSFDGYEHFDLKKLREQSQENNERLI